MHRRYSRRAKVAALILSLSVLGAACGDDDDGEATQGGAEVTTTTAPVGAETPAAVARTNLHGLLQEHVFLAADASGAALAGRTADFQAIAATLDANSNALTARMSSMLGTEFGQGFDPLWKKHIDFFVDYVEGTAAKDQAKRDKAMLDLVAYTTDFGKFIGGALEDPNLAADAVAGLLKTHVLGLKDLVDAQAAKDFPRAWELTREGAQHMAAIAKPLAVSIALKSQEKVKGDPASPAANVLDALNSALREHVYLAADATGAALGGRAEEFTAAAASLDGNSNAITELMTSIFGAEAGKAFDPLWKKHITFFVDYTTGLAGGGSGKSAEAMANLTQYAQDFGAFISSALPSLTTEAVASLVTTHVTTLKSVIDAQAAKDPTKAETNLRQAADHMLSIATPLTAAIVKKFPDLFPGA